VKDRYKTAAEAHAALAPLLVTSAEHATTGVRLTSAFGTATAKVTYRDRLEKTIVEAPRGLSLLDVSLNNRIPHARACNGKAQCTTCRVVILDGGERLSGRSEAEALIAKEEGWPDNIRLACQARVNGDVTLRRLVVDSEEHRDLGGDPSQTLPATERSVVALFCSIRNFRSFALESYPYDVVHVVSRYLRQVAEPITANRGRIETAMGERVIALFGADGSSPPEAATDALRAGLRIAARIKHFNQTLVRTFNHEFELGIGLHYGAVVMGQLHPGKALLTALGDVDEMAMRLERAAHAAGVLIGASPAFLRILQADVKTGKTFPVEARPGETPIEAVEILDFLKPDVVLIVQSTFERVAPRADEFARIFYDQLFELSSEIEGLFDHVNMQVQRKMLMDVLAVAVRGLDHLETLVPTLRELGRRHVGYGVRVAHYKIVGEALLWALKHFFRGDFTPEVELAWREIYGIVAKTMIDASKGPDEKAAVA
jgi:class 3 adenylate cyclase/hemoglobin-like flavoprotein